MCANESIFLYCVILFISFSNWNGRSEMTYNHKSSLGYTLLFWRCELGHNVLYLCNVCWLADVERGLWSLNIPLLVFVFRIVILFHSLFRSWKWISLFGSVICSLFPHGPPSHRFMLQTTSGYWVGFATILLLVWQRNEAIFYGHWPDHHIWWRYWIIIET